ncbi:MAG: 23S rRNA (uracil(1939)-C(5))-methyltransferase RlmD [Lachnospiraceae bacterium]|nr:23S rRNA (uracil(1939)-C(5))-methyltransferase RlmD [Lachnospiraceae bacterium]
MSYDKNQIVTVEITDIGTDGEGIGKIDGFPFFIKDAIVGDVVEARVTKVKKTYAYARVEKVITPSFFRVDPKCEYHRQCGGCQIQAMDYKKQLQFKEQKVRNNLIRIGGFDEDFIDSITESVVGMEEPYFYRNKAQYPVGRSKDGKIVAGFYAGRTHSIIANTQCYLGVKENKEILETILAYMEKYGIEPYEEETGKGIVRHILIRKGFYSGQIMVCLVVNLPDLNQSLEKMLRGKKELIEALCKFEGMTSISVNQNTRRDNVIMGNECKTLWGKDCITDTLGGITFEISPLSFYQVNPIQTQKLYSLAVEYAQLTGKEVVWDLYCGIGTISLYMAQKAGRVCGVEIVPQAIEDAKANAARNGFTNTEFFVGKAEEVLPAYYEAKIKENKEDVMLHPDVICVDPPRKGCDSACLETMLRMAPSRIVYVSCDSATLARDLKILCEGGYELKRVRAVDQFPHTTHVESVVLLSRK